MVAPPVAEGRAMSEGFACVFCREPVGRPEFRLDLFSSDGSLAGRCRCGAVFVIDETGRAGGQAVLDLQALVCGADLDRALTLETGRDIEIVDVPIARREIAFVLPPGGYAHTPPRAWFGRLMRKVTHD
jgi:hypothetical protein